MGRVKGETALIIGTVLFLCIPATANSANSSGLEISGFVKTLTGEPLADIEVRASFPATESSFTTVRSDEEGKFQLAIPPGTGSEVQVILRASLPGYAGAYEPMWLDSAEDSLSCNLYLNNLADSPDQPRLDYLERAIRSYRKKGVSLSKLSLGAQDAYQAGMRSWIKHRNSEEAAAHFLNAARHEPGFTEARLYAALMLMQSGGWTAARQEWEKALRWDPESVEARLVKGVWENFFHQSDSSADSLAKVVEKRPKNWLAHLELARAHYRRKNWSRAEQHLLTGWKAGAPKAEVYYLRARLLNAQGDSHAALANILRLRKKMGSSGLPPKVASFAAEVEESVSGIAAHKLISFLDASLEELQIVVPHLAGLQPPDTAEALPRLLRCAGNKVNIFFRDFQNTTAIETFRQSLFRKNGKVKSSRSETFTYLMILKDFNGQPSVEEMRGDVEGNRRRQGGLQEGFMVTKGFPASLIVLHPSRQPAFDYKHLGSLLDEGRRIEVVALSEKPEMAGRLASFRLQQARLITLHMQGIVWIDSKTCQVLRVRTELRVPYPQIQLSRRTNEVEYQEVKFPNAKRPMWLPKKASVAMDWAGKSLRNEHIFSDFQFFHVETKEILSPVASSKKTVGSKQHVSNQQAAPKQPTVTHQPPVSNQ